MAANRVAGMKIIPSGYSVKNVDGKTYLQKRRRSRKRYKLSKKTRDKISRNARKFKLPILTGAALALPAMDAWNDAANNAPKTVQGRVSKFSRRLIANYTGFYLDDLGRVSFNWRHAAKGLLPLAAVMGAKKIGIFKGANKALGSAKIPVRLS